VRCTAKDVDGYSADGGADRQVAVSSSWSASLFPMWRWWSCCLCGREKSCILHTGIALAARMTTTFLRKNLGNCSLAPHIPAHEKNIRSRPNLIPLEHPKSTQIQSLSNHPQLCNSQSADSKLNVILSTYVLAIALKPSRTPAKGFSPSSMSQNPKITNVIWSLQSSEGV
jgi:hypothetical protein